MKNSQPYVERIKAVAFREGVVLDDEQALDVLKRMVGLVPLVMEKKPKNNRPNTKHFATTPVPAHRR